MAEKPGPRISYERLFGGGVIALLAVALGLSEYGRFVQRDKLVKEVATAKADADAALQAVIAPDLLAEAEKSVYMVLIHVREGVLPQKQYFGTAFVIDRDRGLLATAGHVSKGLPFDLEKVEISVVNRFSGRPLRVLARRTHSAYGALARAADIYQPMEPSSSILLPLPIALEDHANDAGLLIVDPLDAETGKNLLGPNLPIASLQTLAALKAGDPIAVISFPSDVVISNEQSASSRVERGTIATMASAMDLVEIGDPDQRLLIIHRMATAPGSSGAPIFNRSGEIIGIHTHGIPSPQSNGDGGAQRADVLHEMLSPVEEELAFAWKREPDWRKRLSHWVRARDAIPYALYQQKANGPRVAQAIIDNTFENVDFATELPYAMIVHEFKFPGAAPNLFLPASDPGQAAKSAPEAVKAATTQGFLFPNRGRYFPTRFSVDPDKDTVFFAFDYNVAQKERSIGFCPLVIYYRRAGANVFEVVGPLMMPSVYIPAADEQRRIYDVVVFRPATGMCDDDSDEEFMHGTLWWEPAKGAAGAKVAHLGEFAPAALSRRVSYALAQTDARLRNFVNCRAWGSRADCFAPVRASLAHEALDEPRP